MVFVKIPHIFGDERSVLDQLLQETCDEIGRSLLILLLVVAVYACNADCLVPELAAEMVYNNRPSDTISLYLCE